MPSGRSPSLASVRMRVSSSVAPSRRASSNGSGSVIDQPFSTAGITAAGEKTPNVAVTASPVRRPMQAEREQK